MKGILSVLFCLVFALGFGIAEAANKGSGVDMGKYTCGDLLAEDEEGVAYVLMWVDGYLSCETGDLTMDEKWITEMASTIREECSGEENKDKKLMSIVKKLAEL